MQPDQVFTYFGGLRATARALKLSPASVYNWQKRGHVPAMRQYQLEKITGGTLRVEDKLNYMIMPKR